MENQNAGNVVKTVQESENPFVNMVRSSIRIPALEKKASGTLVDRATAKAQKSRLQRELSQTKLSARDAALIAAATGNFEEAQELSKLFLELSEARIG